MSIIYFLSTLVFIHTIQGSGGQSCLNLFKNRGRCIRIYDCEPLMDIVRKSNNLSPHEKLILRTSQCGYENDETPLVCCTDKIWGPNSMKMMGSSVMGSESYPEENEVEEIPSSPPNVSLHQKLSLINDPSCGKYTEPRIISGNETGLFEFPWMALLAYNSGKRLGFYCGGTLINKRYVLTAAHCLVDSRHEKVFVGVRLGDHTLSTEIDCQPDGPDEYCAEKYQNLFYDSYHVHPGYRSGKYTNDIALIRLSSDADMLPPNVRPICLPAGHFLAPKVDWGRVTGWGKTEHGHASDTLLSAKLEIKDNEKCENVYRKNGIRITDKQICAGGDMGNMDSCAGDSGGPLQSLHYGSNGESKWVQQGIVSFGPISCGDEGHPGVYTKISYYMDWILDTIV